MRSASVSTIVFSMHTIILPFHALQSTSYVFHGTKQSRRIVGARRKLDHTCSKHARKLTTHHRHWLDLALQRPHGVRFSPRDRRFSSHQLCRWLSAPPGRTRPITASMGRYLNSPLQLRCLRMRQLTSTTMSETI